ncbi:MAG TPA: hypothetical protein EYO33_29035 [Phycisphaerales bacterium]|nr:hypothetical protein [Phycisphaerales bacterium]
MSELTGKFLTQLKADIALLAAETGEPGRKLNQLAQRIDIDEEADTFPVSLDRERGRVVIHGGHPSVEKLLNNPQRRRSDLLFFISSMMSLLNREEEDITDEHERAFHARLLRFALEEGQGSWAGAV